MLNSESDDSSDSESDDDEDLEDDGLDSEYWHVGAFDHSDQPQEAEDSDGSDSGEYYSDPSKFSVNQSVDWPPWEVTDATSEVHPARHEGSEDDEDTESQFWSAKSHVSEDRPGEEHISENRDDKRNKTENNDTTKLEEDLSELSIVSEEYLVNKEEHASDNDRSSDEEAEDSVRTPDTEYAQDREAGEGDSVQTNGSVKEESW